MAEFQDIDAGQHKQQLRLQLLGTVEISVAGASIAPAAFVGSLPLYAPAFENFVGQFIATTGVSTTLQVRVTPRSGGATGGTFSGDEFPVATIATSVGAAEYNFSWGVARGVLTAPSGGTYIRSSIFNIRIYNTGGTIATAVTISSLECV